MLWAGGGPDTSTLTELPTKAKGCQVHLWRHKKMKGAIKLTTPPGPSIGVGLLTSVGAVACVPVWGGGLFQLMNFFFGKLIRKMVKMVFW